MSFAADLEDDQTENGTQTDKSQGDGGVSLGGGGSGIASPGGGNVGGSGQAAQAEPGKPSSSGSWTNLQSYLTANADQGAQVGSQIAGTVGGQAQTAKNDVDSAASDFNQNVDASTVNADPAGVQKAISDATSAKAGSALDPNDVSGFQKQANASYNGPTDFTKEANYGQAQQDTNTATSSLGELGSEAGRDVLLQNQYKNASNNGYTQGEQNLDQMLLENNPTNQQAFSGLQKQWSGIGGLLGQTAQAENARAQGAVSTDQATAQAAKAALTGATGTFQNGLTQELADEGKSRDANYAAYQAELNQGKFDAATAKALGLQAPLETYGVDPSRFLTESNVPLSLGNVASQDQYAESQALSKLAGAPDAFLPATAPGPHYDPATGVMFDQVGLQQAATAHLTDLIAQNIDSKQGQPDDPVMAQMQPGWDTQYPDFTAAYAAAREQVIQKLTAQNSKTIGIDSYTQPTWTGLQNTIGGTLS